MRSAERVRAAARRARGPERRGRAVRARRARRSARVGDDPNQYFLYTEHGRLRLLLRDLARQVASTRPTSRTSCAPTSPTSCTSSTRTSSATTSSRSSAGMLPDVADRLHAARVPADLPPRRPDGAHRERRALPRGLAAALPRVLSRDRAAARSSCASASSSPTSRTSTCSSRRASFLLERYVDWGIPREKIRFEDYGRLAASPLPSADAEDRPRNRLGFFGQLNPYKGVDVLLEAMADPGRARRPTCTSGSTARTSTCSRTDFQERVRAAARGGRRQRHASPAPYEPRRACRS